MKTRATNPAPTPGNADSVVRGIFCGIFKNAKRCKRQPGQPRPNPAPGRPVRYEVVVHEGDATGTAAVNPESNPKSNPCSTCGFGVPPNPPGNASSRERRAWAMSQIGSVPMANPGPCPTCGRDHDPGQGQAKNPEPLCPGQIRCADGTCVDSVANCDSVAAAPAQTTWGLGGGQNLVVGPPSSGAQMLSNRRQRRAAKIAMGQAGILPTPERLRNPAVGPLLLALRAVNYIPGPPVQGGAPIPGIGGMGAVGITPAAGPAPWGSFQYQGGFWPWNGSAPSPGRYTNAGEPSMQIIQPQPQQNPHSAREANARTGSTYWGGSGFGPPWQHRTPSTPAVGPQGGPGWTGAAPWSSYPYSGVIRDGRLVNAAPNPAQNPARNPGWLALGLTALGGTVVGGILGAGGVAYAACQPRDIQNYGHGLEQGRSVNLLIVEFPCVGDEPLAGVPKGRTGKRFEVTVEQTFEGEPPITFGPQGFDTYESAVAWASEQGGVNFQEVLTEGAKLWEDPEGGVAPPAQNPGGYVTLDTHQRPQRVQQNATLLMPTFQVARAPKTRTRNAHVHATRQRLSNPAPGVFPGPGAHSPTAPLPPQWYQYQGASTAGAPQAPGIQVASPGPPPGVFGQGAACYNDRDCRDNEYCHGGLCVPDPWSGAASRQRPAQNPAQMQSMSVPLAPGMALR